MGYGSYHQGPEQAMKYIDVKQQDELVAKSLREGQTFSFRCHKGLDCFTRCCRNLNLFLYPYDVLRLKNSLHLSSDTFLDRYVDVVLREGNFFPDVLLTMSNDAEKTCPFLTDAGCTVYPDRPDTCRTFPLEQGILFQEMSARDIYFFRPPDFCLGRYESDAWTTASWAADQGAEVFHRMTARWAEVKALFQKNPWGMEGPSGQRARMAFMATYNLDQFRSFVFGSSFLKRYKVKQEVLKRLETDEVALMAFGFEWVKFFVWGIPSKRLRLR
jgi:Fe-S-cluster containining protein